MNCKWAGSHLKAAVKELLSLSWQFCSQIWGAEKQLEQQSCWIGKTKYVHGQNFHMGQKAVTFPPQTIHTDEMELSLITFRGDFNCALIWQHS
jgi:hypothetical protein